MSGAAAALVAALLFGHFLGDFTPLATPRMLAAKAVGKPVGPIVAHAFVHAVLTVGAVLLVSGLEVEALAVAGGVQLGTHFLIDWSRGLAGARWKAVSEPGSQVFWTALGVDQFLHGAVLVAIAYLVL